MNFTFELSGYQLDLPDEFPEWAQAFQTGMLDSWELLHLSAALAAFPWSDGAIVVEIGAYVGTTTVFMAKVLERLGRRVPILSIDPFERFQPDELNAQGVYQAYVDNIRANGVEHVCLPLAAFSYDAAPVVPATIGVLVIDGDHRYHTVSRDLGLYSARLLPGGFLFLDDTAPPYNDVVRAAEEFFAASPDYVIHARQYFTLAQKKPAPQPGPPGKRRKRTGGR